MSAIPAASPVSRQPTDLAGSAGMRPAGPAGTRPATGRPGNTGPATVPSAPAAWPAGRRVPDDHLVAITRNFVVLFLEVEAGCRPRAQLAKLLTPMLYARLTDIWVRGGCPGQVITVSLLDRAPAHCDLIAIVRRGRRCGALSLRLLRVPGRGWLVDVIARQEDGHLPPPAYPVLADPTGEEPPEIPPVTADAYRPQPDWLALGSPG